MYHTGLSARALAYVKRNFLNDPRNSELRPDHEYTLVDCYHQGVAMFGQKLADSVWFDHSKSDPKVVKEIEFNAYLYECLCGFLRV